VRPAKEKYEAQKVRGHPDDERRINEDRKSMGKPGRPEYQFIVRGEGP
jgi:hypothetical protein